MPATVLPNVRADAYRIDHCSPSGDPTPDTTPAWYFYFEEGDTIHCWTYNAAGDELEEVGSGLSGSEVDFQGCIPAAAGYHGAARLMHSLNALHVYDFAADRIVTYDVPAPWVAGPAQFVAGHLHWIEWQPGPSLTMPTRLMRAGFDFDSPEQVGTHQATLFGSQEATLSTLVTEAWTDDFRGPDFTDAAAAIFVRHHSEVELWVRIRFDLATGIGSHRAWDSGDPAVEEGPPTEGTVAKRAGWPLPSGGSLRLVEEGLDAWSGGLHDFYEPWNREHLNDTFRDFFIADGRIYLPWGVSTPIDPDAEPDAEPATGGEIIGFCKVAAP